MKAVFHVTNHHGQQFVVTRIPVTKRGTLSQKGHRIVVTIDVEDSGDLEIKWLGGSVLMRKGVDFK